MMKKKMNREDVKDKIKKWRDSSGNPELRKIQNDYVEFYD